MHSVRSLLLTSILALSLVGCTYSDPVLSREASRAAPLREPHRRGGPVTLQGQFQSQGAPTTGTATIRVTDSGAVLQLEDFATGPGDILRLMLSPGIGGPGPGGELQLSSSTLIELGPLPLARSSSQRVDMDSRMWESMPKPVRSVVIYNNAEKTAYGTANLTEAPRS